MPEERLGQILRILGETWHFQGHHQRVPVAVEAGMLLVASPYDMVGGTDGPGQVHVYHRYAGGLNRWGRVNTLRASDPQTGWGFGYPMVLDGDTLAVGRRNGVGGWWVVKKIYASDPVAGAS